jgi:hypothetical protein
MGEVIAKVGVNRKLNPTIALAVEKPDRAGPLQ